MADQLLSIDDSTLTAIASAIRSKGGLPSSNKLSFPDGMVAALQDIVTEATVTPKITPQAKTLTPSDTSFAITPGFHDGTGTVKIETEPGSANPTSSEVTYYPSAGKFFSSFVVGGTGAGYQVVTGTITIGKDRTCNISGLSFTPAGAMVVRTSDTGATSGDRLVAFETPIEASGNVYYGTVAYSKRFMHGPPNSAEITYSQGSINIYTYAASYPFNGTYSYVVWGS